MNNNILFEQVLAEELNERVRKIAGHLFLFCDYSPSTYPVFSSDAKFLLGVLNLYWLTVDASIVSKLGIIAKKTSSVTLRNIYFDTIKPIVDESQMLRAVFAHNQGKWEGGHIFAYHEWIFEHLQKREIEGVEDYSSLFVVLLERADKLVSSLENFLAEAAKLNRKEIISVWEDLLLKFYRRNQGREMIRCQIEETYCALLAENRNSAVYRDALKTGKIEEWIKKRYLGEFLAEKQRWSALIEERKICDPRTIQQLQKKIEEAENNIQKTNEYIGLKCAKQLKKLRPYDYLNTYILDTLDKFKDRLSTLKDGDSMLPHGILQEIIVSDMKHVSLP